MSHQGGGPRNYVHRDFHNQVVEGLKKRVAVLERDVETWKRSDGLWSKKARAAEARATELETKIEEFETKERIEREIEDDIVGAIGETDVSMLPDQRGKGGS